MKKRGFILFVIFCLSSPFVALALDTETHKEINKYIAMNTLNSFSLDSYLKNQLGFTNGIKEEFTSDKTKKAWEWVQWGGEYEDTPPSFLSNYLLHRYTNHFHNPLAPTLENAGFSGVWDTGLFSGESAILWSQKPIGTQNSGGNYSWNDVREYYWLALTSENKDVRSSYFAETFRGIGQLMHLVEDMSVPQHARNDGHYLPAYERWVEDTRNSEDAQRKAIFDTALVNPTTYSLSDLGQPSAFTNAPIPIANLFDTNQYTGTDPTITTNQNIGLAEYTNANFFSEDTIFAGNFPYPQITQGMTVREDDFTNNMTTYKRQYYLKNCCGETKGGLGYRLAAVDLLDYWRQQDPERYGGLSKIPALDDNVYSDYASLLIPRAVGYSAELLNYFFRGQIDMVSDPNSPGNYIIENYSNEAINASDGVFTLYYDGTDDQRHQINWTYPSDGRISVPAANGNDPGKSMSVSFSEPNNPPSQVPGKYILVYKGTLGNEHDMAVVGKDVSTPEFLYSAVALWYGWIVEKRNGKDGSLIWSQTLANMDSSPTAITVSGDGVFVCGWVDYYAPKWRIEKRSIETGELVWSQEMSSDFTGDGWSMSSGIKPMDISVDNYGVYLIGKVFLPPYYEGIRYEKRDINTGEVLWEIMEVDLWAGNNESWSCVVDDSGVYFGTERFSWENEGGIEKRSKNSGGVLWGLETGMYDAKVAIDDEFIYASDYVPNGGIALYGDQPGLYIVKIHKNSGVVAGIFRVPDTIYNPSPGWPTSSVTADRLMIDESSIYLLAYPIDTPITPTLIKIDKNTGAMIGSLNVNAYKLEMGKEDLYVGYSLYSTRKILKFSKSSLMQKWDTGPLPYSGYPEVQSMSVFSK